MIKKIKNTLSFIDNLLSRFRRLFVNGFTAFFLLIIVIGVFSSIASFFESDKIETKDKILYLEPKGVIVDKSITRDDPFDGFEIFGGSTNQIELENFANSINNGVKSIVSLEDATKALKVAYSIISSM